MSDLVILLAILKAKSRRQLLQVRGGRRDEVPMRESGGIILQIGQAVFAQDRRRIVSRIEADADQ